MKVEIKSKTDVKGILFVEIPKEIIDQEKEKSANKIQKNAKISGFRQGKASIDLVKTRFKDEIISEAINKLFQDKSKEALEQVNIKAVTVPKIENINFDPDSSLSFEIIFETKPTISLCEVKDLKWEKEIVEVEETEIERNLLNLQDQLSEFNPIENQPVAKGNVVIIDMSQIENNTAVKNWENLQIEIGKNMFLDWLENGMIGLNQNDEKEIPFNTKEKELVNEKLKEINSSSENTNEPILQKIETSPIIYKVKIKKILEKTLPKIDDEFAKKFKFENLDKLKDEVRTELKNRKETLSLNKLKDKVIDYLHDHISFELPESLVESEFIRIKKIYRDYLEKEKQNFKEEIVRYEDENSEEMKKTAKKNISTSFIINEFAEKNKITLTKEEINKVLEQTTKINKGKKYFEEEMFNQLTYEMLFNKTIDFILKNGEIIEVKAKEVESKNENEKIEEKSEISN